MNQYVQPVLSSLPKGIILFSEFSDSHARPGCRSRVPSSGGDYRRPDPGARHAPLVLVTVTGVGDVDGLCIGSEM